MDWSTGSLVESKSRLRGRGRAPDAFSNLSHKPKTVGGTVLRVSLVMTLAVGLITTVPRAAQASDLTGVERGDINTTGTNGTSIAVADSAGSQSPGTWMGSATPTESVSNTAGFILALKPAQSSLIAFRSAASSSTGGGSGVTSFDAKAPLGVQPGDLILAFQGGRTPGTITPPDSSWHLGRSVQPSSGHHFWYWKIAGPSEPATYHWQSSAATKWAFVTVAYSGVDTASPIHAEAGQVAPGSGAATRSTPSISTNANTWLVQAFAHRSTHSNASWGGHMLSVDTSPPGTCGLSGTKTICVTVPGGGLTGHVPIKVTSSGSSGRVYVTWTPAGGSPMALITKRGPSPSTNDYSFTWPTNKYVDGSGVLLVHADSPTNPPVSVTTTLANGNVSDFQHNPNDWSNYLPSPTWNAGRDPMVATVGDGASDEPEGNNLVQGIAASNPDLFLYLGDIYEEGTFTENLNHYGQNTMDGGSGSLWGTLGAKTQPTIGNHEAGHLVDWQDYWHGRPLYDSFRFGNVLFLNLASDLASMAQGSAQYNYVKGILESPTSPPPPCIVTFFHRPTLDDGGISSSRLPMWSLLTNNGGDLVLNGHSHSTVVHKPLNDQMQLPSPGQPTMVQMVFGAGGTGMGSGWADEPRIEWKVGGTPGATYITLNGAANGGIPTSLTWVHKDTAGNVLRSGTRDCGAAPPPPAAPSITGFTPASGPVGTSVTIAGTGFTGATQVTFNSTAATFNVSSSTQITTTVPNATSGPIRVVTPGGTATSATSFTVTTPPPDTTPPETVIDSGPSGSVSETSATFTFSANEPATFQCALDGAAYASCSSPVTFNNLSFGAHTFRVFATDGSSNADQTPAERSWTVIDPGPSPNPGELIGNPGFEVNTSGWRGEATSNTLTRVPGGHSGGFAVEVSKNVAGGSCGIDDHPNWVSSTQAGTYTASIWARSNTPGVKLKIRVREYLGGAKRGTVTKDVTLTSAWQQVAVTYTVASPGSSLDFEAYSTNAGAGVCFQADDASIKHSSLA